MLYEKLIRPLIFRLEPERAHRLTISLLKILQAWIELKWAVLVVFSVAGMQVSQWFARAKSRIISGVKNLLDVLRL